MDGSAQPGRPHPVLLGRARWLFRPSAIGHSAGALAAGAYALVTLRLPELAGWPFIALVAAMLGALTVVTELRARARLRTLRAVGEGRLPTTREHLTASLKEVARMGDFSFTNGLVSWAAGTIGVAAVMRLSVGLEWSQVVRIGLLGILFGPPTAMMVALFVGLRIRQVIRELSAGLSFEQVLETLPPRRMRLRARVVAFTSVSVISTAVIATDVAGSLARAAVEQVLSANPTSRVEVAAAANLNIVLGVAALCAVMVGLALATAYAAGAAIGMPMRLIAEESTRLARGELGSTPVIPAEDELWAVSSAFSTMHAHLVEVLSKVQSAGLRIGSTAEQILATSKRHEVGAAGQASSLNETSVTTEELARSARAIADNAAQVAEMASRTLDAAEQGRVSAEELAASVKRMRQDNQAIADSVVRLNGRVQQIGKIVEVINAVADRSDLLALNAELEGTKAGEVGRAFSLVAGEMRRLAENVLESTREIELLIEEIRGATREAVAATAEGVSATEGGLAVASSVSESLERIVELAGRTFDAARSISLATQQQQSGTDQLAETMTEILRITDQSLRATRKVTEANSVLSSTARDLREVVDRFRIGS